MHAFLPGQHCYTYYTNMCTHSCQVRASLQAAHASHGRLPYAALLTMQSKLAQFSLHPRVAFEKQSIGNVDYRFDQ